MPKFRTLTNFINDWASSDDLVITAVCRSGRHRSVALCEILAQHLRNTGSYSVTVCHAERTKWGSLCTSCSDCTDNVRRNQIIDSALHDAWL